ncbi:MAG TPA: VgrG-related protein [Actinomycetota bacterium]|nr:VgrG-related protein [Actinomycetota bacterium]
MPGIDAGAVSYATESLVVKVNAAALDDDLLQRLLSVTVDDSVSLPAAFALVFRDPFHDVVSTGGFDFGTPVTISFADGTSLLGKGEVTATECELEPTGTLTVIRGFDVAHRLHRGRTTAVYRDESYADIARKVASRAGLQTGTVDTPRMTVPPQVMQWNQSDWEFLKGLASEVGFDLGVSDGKLHFRERPAATAGPSTGGLDVTDPRQITLENVTRFRCVVSGAEQVSDVEVRGWNPLTKKEVVGTARVAAPGVALGATPDAAAGKLRGKTLTSVDKLYERQSDATAAARALAEEVGGSFGNFEGLTHGNPALRAGVPVSLGLAGGAFEGKYTLTATRHTFDEDGYTTWFASTGAGDDSLLAMTVGVRERAGVDGVVPAVVTDVRDPSDLGRVKVTFPWLSRTNESFWARVAQPWVGRDYGSVFVPEVNDEVLVAFEQGDFARPYVVGGLYNGVEKPNTGSTPLVDDASGTVNVRRMATRKQHTIELVDKFGGEGIFVRTGDGGQVVELDVANTRIAVTSNGKVTIDGAQGIEIKTTAALALKASQISLDAKQIKVNAEAMLNLKGGAMAVLEGGLVKIN